MFRTLLLAAICWLSISAWTVSSALGATFSTVRVASGLSNPLYVTAVPGDRDRLFIVEKSSGGGTAEIKILDLATQSVNATPFLTVSNLATSGERGLLGLAFHPEYETNGWFYVNFTNASGDTVVRRYQVSGGDADVADPNSAMDVLTIDQPATNHNGGWMGFGPNDGYLYIAVGDGGGSNDPSGNGQNPNTLLGTMLRLDIDVEPEDEATYLIPEDNPFVDGGGAAEVWAYGLRNPWRDSFDRATGDFYIADVGQNAREEVNFQPAASTGGENYGWVLREGTIQNPASSGGPRPPGNVDPIHDYAHTSSPADSITGGYVYRGPIASLDGKYFFADVYRNQIWSLEHNGTSATELIEWTGTQEFAPNQGSVNSIVSFGEDALGNLYLVDIGGEVFMLQSPDPLEAGDIDQDYDFDQFDVIEMLARGQYLLNDGTATWSDGDFDGASGGAAGLPPAGDGNFDQFDLIDAVDTGNYLQGDYRALSGLGGDAIGLDGLAMEGDAVAAGGALGDGQTSIVYDATTGEVLLDVAADASLTSINIASASEIFTGNAAENLRGIFDIDSDNTLFKANFDESFASLSLGNVAQPGLSQAFLLANLRVAGSTQTPGGLGEVDLVFVGAAVVAEPAVGTLLGLGLLVLAGLRGVARRRGTG